MEKVNTIERSPKKTGVGVELMELKVIHGKYYLLWLIVVYTYRVDKNAALTTIIKYIPSLQAFIDTHKTKDDLMLGWSWGRN